MLLRKKLNWLGIIRVDQKIRPNKRHANTMNGAGTFEYCNTRKVPIITAIFMKLTVFNDMIETSFNKYKVAAIIIPTTAALMPSRERYTTTNFRRFCHTGKKNSTNKALGKKIAIEPMKHPSN